MSAYLILAATILNAVNGAFAPDGRRVAFQRHNGHDFDLGIVDLASNEIEWVEKGPAQSAYPAWSRQGALAFVRADYDETSFQAVQAKSQKGCDIHVYENGKTRQITWGREFDAMPSFSPDGKYVYFSSSRNTGMYGKTQLWRVDAAGQTWPVMIRRVGRPEWHSFGAGQPCVSPDGRHLLWSESPKLRDPWHILVADVGLKGSPLVLTPDTEYAYAPCWHPNGDYIAYTTCRRGDPGWCIYLMHVKSGSSKRLCPGKNPCFSPDGKSILFDDDHDITIRELTRDDFPKPRKLDEGKDFCDLPEKVVVRKENLAAGATGDFPELKSVGTNDTVFVRATFDWNGDTSGVEAVFDLNTKSNCHVFELYLDKGRPWFSTRNPQGLFEGVREFVALQGKGRHKLVGVRAGNTVHLSVDGAAPFSLTIPRGVLAVDEPMTYAVGKVGEVLSVEVGTGWPKDVPPVATFGRVFPTDK